MRRLYRFLGMLVLCGAVMGLVSSSHAQSGDNEESRGEKKFKEVLDQLNLSEDQQSLLKTNKSKHANETKEMRSNLRATMQQLGDELKQKDLDMVKINELRTKFKALRNQMADERFEAILGVRKILNQEQFEKFIELTDKRKNER